MRLELPKAPRFRGNEPAVLRNPRLARTRYIFAVVCTLCVLAISPVAAKPAKDGPPWSRPQNKDLSAQT